MNININISSDKEAELKIKDSSIRDYYWAKVIEEATKAATEAVKGIGADKADKTQFSYLGKVDLNQIFEPGLYLVSRDSDNLPSADFEEIEEQLAGSIDRLFLKVSPYETVEPPEGWEGYYTGQTGTTQELTIMGYADEDEIGDFSIVYVRGLDVEKDTADTDYAGVMTYGWVKVADSRPTKDTTFYSSVTNLNQALEPGIYPLSLSAKGIPTELSAVDTGNGIMVKISNRKSGTENSMLQEITANVYDNDTGEEYVAIWVRYIFIDGDVIDAYNWIKTADSRQLTS